MKSGAMEYWSIGVVEYRSIGMVLKGLIPDSFLLSITPSLHYSTTPFFLPFASRAQAREAAPLA